MNDYEPTSLQTAVKILAAVARTAIELGVEPERAVRMAAVNAVRDGRDARARRGAWAPETPTEQVEDACFLAAVAVDVLDGTVSRPSTGNLHDAVLTAAQEKAPH